MQMLIRDLMTEVTSDLLTGISLRQAEETLFCDRNRELYIVNNQRKLLGKINEDDFLNARLAGIPRQSVDDLMDRHPISVSPYDDLHRIQSRFLESNSSGLPVVDGGLLVGQVLKRDFLRLLLLLDAMGEELTPFSDEEYLNAIISEDEEKSGGSDDDSQQLADAAL